MRDALAAQGVEKEEGSPEEVCAYLAAELREQKGLVNQSGAAK